MRLSNSERPPKPFDHSDLMSFQDTHMGTTFEIQVRYARRRKRASGSVGSFRSHRKSRRINE